MNCDPKALARYVDGALDQDALVELLNHVSDCRLCRDALMEVRRWQHRGQYRSSPELLRPGALAGRVLDELDKLKTVIIGVKWTEEAEEEADDSPEAPAEETGPKRLKRGKNGSKRKTRRTPEAPPEPVNEEETMATMAKESNSSAPIPIEKSADAGLKERLEALLEEKIQAIDAEIAERTRELQEERLKLASDLHALRNEYSLVPFALEFPPMVIGEEDGVPKRAVTPPGLLDTVVESILDELGRGPKSTSELVRELGSIGPTVFRPDTGAQVMRRLEKRGLVKGRKLGVKRTDPVVWSLAEVQRKTA